MWAAAAARGAPLPRTGGGRRTRRALRPVVDSPLATICREGCEWGQRDERAATRTLCTVRALAFVAGAGLYHLLSRTLPCRLHSRMKLIMAAACGVGCGR